MLHDKCRAALACFCWVLDGFGGGMNELRVNCCATPPEEHLGSPEAGCHLTWPTPCSGAIQARVRL